MSRSASHASVLAAYPVIDFLAVLFGYEILGERTLEEFRPSAPTVCRPVHGPV